MSGQRHATMVAAVSLGLTLTPLVGVFSGLAWTIPVLLVVAVVATAGTLTRSAGRGQGLQTLAMAAALLVLMTALFNGETAIALLIPTPATFAHWLTLAGDGVNDIIVMAPPVEAQGGILFLTMMGVGTVAILHDMFIVGLRTPALAGLTLLTMYLVPVSVAPEATAWFWFILPAVAYLWILADDNLRRVSRFGHRFTGSGRLVGSRFPSPLAATARVTGAVFVALTLLLLTMVPANTSGLVDQVSEGYGDGDGPGGGIGELDPWARLSGSLNQPEPQELLRVTTDDPSPRYLRMHVADVLTSEGFGPSVYDDLQPLDSLTGGGQVFTAEVENLRMEDEVLPVYGRPTEIDLGDEWGVDPETEVITSMETSLEDVDSYTVQYTDPDWDPATLAAAGETPANDVVFTRNTIHPNVPEMTEQVEELLAESGAETVHEKTLAVLDFLSPANGFSYSLETVDAGNEEAILDFLEVREGFCQQYAGAMAWMLREADVPARVAIGLTKGTYSGGVWTVGSDNFHAWVEVYYEGLGWITFDPTPSGGVANSVNFPWATEPSDEADPVEQPSQNPDDGPTSTTPTEAPTLADELDPSTQAEADEQDAAGGGTGGGWFDPVWLALLPLLAVPFAPALWRVALRRSRLEPRRLSAQSAWDETRDLAVDYGIELHDSLTPRQAAAVFAQAVPDAQGAVGALASAVEHHRYSPRGADAAALPAAVQDLRALLDKNASSRRRFGAVFWPASLGSRFTEQRGRTAERLTDLRAKAPWARRSNGGGDEAVTGRP